MDLRQLTAVVTVADVGSITRAARMLDLVQPTVTRRIKLLEDELGVTLFERTTRGVVPTSQGEAFVEHARRALRELDRGRAEVRPELTGLSGLVTVGLLDSVIDLLAGPVTTEVAAAHPGIELRLLSAYSGHLQQWLDDGDVDVSLLYNLASSPSPSVVPLVEETLWAVAPLGSGLDPDLPVSCEVVMSHPLVLPVAGHGLRVLIDQVIAQVGASPRIVVEVNSLHAQKQLVYAGHGWSILPAAGASADIDAGRLDGAPLDRPTVGRQVVLGLPRSGRVPAPVQEVTRILGKVVRRLVRDGSWAGATLVRPDAHAAGGATPRSSRSRGQQASNTAARP